MIVSDSFVVPDWADPGTRPGRPIAPLHARALNDVFEEHDSELLV